MKKRIVMALVLLASLSMLISSLAHASSEDLDTMCSTAQTQYLNGLQKEIADNRALLAQVSDEDSKDLLTVRILDLESQLKDMNEVNCP